VICKWGITVNGALVPCGKCPMCRVNKQRTWAGRIITEWMTHPEQAYFVTLTYDDDNLPITSTGDPTLEPKRLRKWAQNVQKVARFRYFLVGEYGARFGRPHYHLAVFPDTDVPISQITDEWKCGFTSTYPLDVGNVFYMLKDLTKSVRDKEKDSERRALTGQEGEFRTSSRKPPIGAAFISVLVASYSTVAGKTYVEKNGDVGRSFRFRGKILPISRYVLGKVREALGIPRLHEERMAHPGYYELYAGEEFAEWEPTEGIAKEIQLNAKAKANELRKTARRL
jgi:hypothetical protein